MTTPQAARLAHQSGRLVALLNLRAWVRSAGGVRPLVALLWCALCRRGHRWLERRRVAMEQRNETRALWRSCYNRLPPGYLRRIRLHWVTAGKVFAARAETNGRWSIACRVFAMDLAAALIYTLTGPWLLVYAATAVRAAVWWLLLFPVDSRRVWREHAEAIDSARRYRARMRAWQAKRPRWCGVHSEQAVAAYLSLAADRDADLVRDALREVGPADLGPYHLN